MYLLDTNIWLERLLGQDQAEIVGRFLDKMPTSRLLMTDFTLHSIGVILGRLGEKTVFSQFVQDVLLDNAINLVRLAPADLLQIISVMSDYQLDFDDGYQYVAAEREGLVIVSFDSDFDRTKRGRQTPAEILAADQGTDREAEA